MSMRKQTVRELSKCSSYKLKIHYLGHIIFDEGIDVGPAKVEDIMEWNTPKTYMKYATLWV